MREAVGTKARTNGGKCREKHRKAAEKVVNTGRILHFQPENTYFQPGNAHFQPKNVYFQPGNETSKRHWQTLQATSASFPAGKGKLYRLPPARG